MIDSKNGVKYLKKDYFVLSLYILLRYLKKHYVFEQTEHKLFDEFSKKFYNRLVRNDESDTLILQFRDNRQQSVENLETRERIMRLVFFQENKEFTVKDTKRRFDEAERIQIYMDKKGICKLCFEEFIEQGLSNEEAEKKARISWSEFDADHIKAYISGGKTIISNAEVLCRNHNRAKRKH
jgi:hypothetical protein